MHWVRLFCLCAILVVATSCTRLDIAVSWADNYIASSVDDYFDLSSRQNKELKQSLQKDIAKIRREQFKKWADYLRRIEKDLTENTLTAEVEHKYFVEALETSRKLSSHFEGTAVRFVTTLTPEQMVYFEKETKKKDLEREEKLQNPVKVRKELRKKYVNGIEMWIDSLSKEQDLLLDKHLDEHPFPQKAQLKNRIQLERKFREAEKSQEELKKFVHDYYADPTRLAEPEYRKSLDAYQVELEKLIFQLANSLSEKQKKKFSENLLDKAISLERLAEKK